MFLSACKSSADVVFVLDASGSVSRADFRLMISAVINLIAELEIPSKTRVGLMVYSTGVKVVFPLNR